MGYNIRSRDQVEPYWEAAIAEAEDRGNPVPATWIKNTRREWTLEQAYEAVQLEAVQETNLQDKWTTETPDKR